ncbi:unnamed protein product [Symbiodinium natans]|uniref:Uncharacterized protein n=1 Tax=Symbiodinium natans TaxID=878477 RepID=A0A812MVL9_9DINO|nr:unnamed protein product [Symbiodinium natans]
MRSVFVIVLSILYTSSASSGASSAAPALPGRSLRGAEDARLLQLMPEDTTPRVGVPQCGPGYVDSTAGNARYPWRCAASCPGGMWWASHDCFCACVPSQSVYTPPPSSVTSQPVTSQRPQTTMGYVPVQPSPAPSPYVYEAPKEPNTTPAPASATPAARAAPQAEGGDFPVGAAATVVGILLVCGAITCLWVCLGPGPEKSVLVAEVPAVTVHSPKNYCPQPPQLTDPVKPPRSSSKMSTVTVSSDHALIPGSRKSSRVSCGSIGSQTSNPANPQNTAPKNNWEMMSTTSSCALPPVIINSTLWAHHVDEVTAGSQSRQLTPERSRGSSKMSRVEPETSSRGASKSSTKSRAR